MRCEGLTFKQFQGANRQRCIEALHSLDGHAWPKERWFLAIYDESGEVYNLLEKVLGGDFSLEEKRTELLKGLADIITYADLAISSLGGDTAECLSAKFNEVSRSVGWAE